MPIEDYNILASILNPPSKIIKNLVGPDKRG